MPSADYVDNAVPFGGFVADIKRGGTGSATTICASAIFESCTPSRPSVGPRRPNEIGGPNGFAIVAAQVTYSGTVQIATATTETPKVGDWFTHIFDGKVGATAETVVFDSISDPKEMGSYMKANFTAHRAYNPPS